MRFRSAANQTRTRLLITKSSSSDYIFDHIVRVNRGSTERVKRGKKVSITVCLSVFDLLVIQASRSWRALQDDFADGYHCGCHCGAEGWKERFMPVRQRQETQEMSRFGRQEGSPRPRRSRPSCAVFISAIRGPWILAVSACEMIRFAQPM